MIGSIVLLEGTTKALMIYGKNQIHLPSKQKYDYIACLYPEGYIDDKFNFFFNQNQVKSILYKPCFTLDKEINITEDTDAFQ